MGLKGSSGAAGQSQAGKPIPENGWVCENHLTPLVYIKTRHRSPIGGAKRITKSITIKILFAFMGLSARRKYDLSLFLL